MEKNILLFNTLFIFSLFLTNCGKHEEEGRVIGTATGAALGAAVAGRHSRGEGAILGGLVGNIIGGEYGRAKDEEVEDRKIRKETRKLKAENRDLRRKLTTKWCSSCSRKVRIRGAQSCPECGGKLIREKFCRTCSRTFSPDTGYRYCPYCSERVKLKGR